MEKITLRQQLESFDLGVFLDSSGSVDSGCFNFYDWFCKDSSLEKKAIKLFKNVKTFLKHHPEIDIDKHYVFFKNNCPMVGSLYDDFRICDIEKGNVGYTVVPTRTIPDKTNPYGRNSTTTYSEMWGSENGFKEPLKEGKTFKDLFKD
jgi:hypothetical protein